MQTLITESNGLTLMCKENDSLIQTLTSEQKKT